MAKGIAIMSVAHRKALIEAEPTAIRLSAHPKPVNSAQLGAHLHADHSISGTPWHNAAVYKINDKSKKCAISFVKATEAQEEGHKLKTDKNGKPSHFVSKDVYKHACTLQRFFQSVHKQKLAEKSKAVDLTKKETVLAKAEPVLVKAEESALVKTTLS